MKKIGVLLLCSWLLITCSSPEEGVSQGYRITGKIINGGNSPIYLGEILNRKLNVIDTAILASDGSFEMEGFLNEKGIYHLNLRNVRAIVFVLDNNPIEITANANDLYNYEVKGSEETLELMKFLKEISNYNMELQGMPQQFAEAVQQKPMAAQQMIRQQYEAKYNALYAERSKYLTAFIRDSETILSYYAMDFLNPKNDLNIMKDFAEKMKSELPKSKYTASLLSNIERISRVSIGAIAPEIALPNPSGDIMKLSSLRGKVTLVDFWASWCAPCRKENPNIVRVYNLYKEKGFDIYSVSIDNKLGAWVKAIEKDNLTWANHVSELSPKRWKEKVIQLYNVNAVPSNFLLDKEGNIIAKNIMGSALEAKLAEILL